MNGRVFKLGTFAKPGGAPFVGIVLDDDVVDLAMAHAAYRAAARRGDLRATGSLLAVLDDWEANFPVLQEIVAFVEQEGLRSQACKLASLRALPPVIRPGKMFYAAQNFQEHVDEMIRAGMTRRQVHRREIDDAALSLPEGAELSRRRLRSYRDPARNEED
jgi:hypothetical protein